ncbi:MAG TPA: hypothetical protein VN577_11360 [Terriglobales bacterium]|nr:hypothetical protein [Terriglobales bacterium]
MTLLIAAWTIGLILSLLALGVYISFRLFHFPDITVDGSVTLGAAVAAVLIVGGTGAGWAIAVAFVAGCVAGAVTGIVHTKFGVHKLLSGILVMTALYSINLHLMGKSNVPLLSERTLPIWAEGLARRWWATDSLNVAGWRINIGDLATLLVSGIVVAAVCVAMFWFFRTNLGTAMRATGDNDQMMRALAVNTKNMTILGLALSNGLVAISGALLAQYQGFADVQMGIGMIVWGLASVIIGQALVGPGSLGLAIVGTVMGSVLFRLIVALALRWGLNPNDLKLVTATFVFVALVLPGVLKRVRLGKKVQVAHA